MSAVFDPHSSELRSPPAAPESGQPPASGQAAQPEPGKEVAALLEQLDDYFRERGLEGETLTTSDLCFACALARYRFAPPSGRMILERTHVMVFGGAGAGKSTIANIMAGVGVAEVNAQSGYTRHPVAIFRGAGDVDDLWPAKLGMLRREDHHRTFDVDENVYEWRRLDDDGPEATPPIAMGDDQAFLQRHVVWDCPDLTTKDATRYQDRMIEIGALADVAVYVASDERYNDEAPTRFLQHMLDAGKWVVVALTKVTPEEADQLVRLFENQVLAQLRQQQRVLAVLATPAPPPGKLDRLWTDEFPHGVRLRSTIAEPTIDLAAARRRSRLAAAQYLQGQSNHLLGPLRRDREEWEAWTRLVRETANEAVGHYERECLARMRHEEFRVAQERLLALLEWPGSLGYLSRGLGTIRAPYGWLKTLVRQFTPRGEFDSVDDDDALDEARHSILDSIRIAIAARRFRHLLWRDLRDSLDQSAAVAIEAAYHQRRALQREEWLQRLRRIARSAVDSIADRPGLLVTLRTFRSTLDLLAIGVIVIWVTKLTFYSVLVVPLVAGIVDELVRSIARRYMERRRLALIREQKKGVRELIRTTYIDTLLRIPATFAPRLRAVWDLPERLTAGLSETVRLFDKGKDG